ncbi:MULTISPECIES: hypothetical protein [Rathayibacter]|jgi:hypothetical protein|uniref:Fe-S oxidoreductase n=1 Tax=Rathayibacter festucae TaxID=110937 RepID=A0ABX6GZX0_9MICO|nr:MULTISPECIES: hypothetical protein [Rathayibacter]MCJ1673276.1 hypothetical protein [Rathayibacter sp. VKM Ac-2929]MCJ1682975.1 hypothetical protein [Rathayibacter sp. VKM Ac-2928]MCJ1700054.1 hypothetical protein [Rathayibacter festucae]QHC63081.1 hypothetical protein GSU69_10560 [Rathayibacter festucae]ROP48360.1 hypothetical protein EDF45_3103 [Rathayibacter sp. PhB186]
MQLGTRWPVGGDTPSTLPEIVVTAVRDVEGELAAAGTDSSAWRWTLTWLEGKPVLELDDGTTITYRPDEDAAYITQPQGRVEGEDDDWG